MGVVELIVLYYLLDKYKIYKMVIIIHITQNTNITNLYVPYIPVYVILITLRAENSKKNNNTVTIIQVSAV